MNNSVKYYGPEVAGYPTRLVYLTEAATRQLQTYTPNIDTSQIIPSLSFSELRSGAEL